MAIDERTRHRLFLKLEDKLGSDDAAALMELLPPVGWADVATKHDLDLRFEVNRVEHEALKLEILAAMRGELQHQTRTFMIFVATFGVSLVAATIGAAKLL
ncbi:MAG: hypothetical protein WD770_00305 [Actinomycetota bacterium]